MSMKRRSCNGITCNVGRKGQVKQEKAGAALVVTTERRAAEDEHHTNY